MRRKVLWMVGAGCLGLLLAVSGLAADKVIFRLNWIPSGEGDLAFAYVAQELGYYKEEDLEVTIQIGSGSADAVALVDAGRVDIALAGFESIAVARARGAKVVIVACFQVNSPYTIWTRADTGIESIRDLAGRTIGAPPGDAQRVAFPAIARATGLDPDSVQWVNIHPGAKIQSLAAKVVDATVHFFDQMYLYEQAIGKDNLRYFRWADYGVNPYGLMFVVHEDTLKIRPNVIRRFLQASFRGVRWMILHPREAIAIMQRYVPEVEIIPVTSMLEQSIKYMLFDNSVMQYGLGWIDPARMKASVDLVNTYYELPRKLSPEELYTTALLPHVTWPYPTEFENPNYWPLPYEFRY